MRNNDYYEVFEQVAAVSTEEIENAGGEIEPVSLGKKIAWSLCCTFAGEQITFPKTLLRAKRDIDIKKEFAEGASYRDLSRKYDLTTRQIRFICHEAEEPAAEQFELFNF